MNVSNINFGYTPSYTQNINGPGFKCQYNQNDDILITSRVNALDDLECELVNKELSQCKNTKYQLNKALMGLKNLINNNQINTQQV